MIDSLLSVESPLYRALIASTIAGFLLTGLGGTAVFFVQKVNERVNNCLLSFAAGVMLAATFFSLILPALRTAEQAGYSKVFSTAAVIGCMFLGALFLNLVHHLLPHEHFKKGLEGPSAKRLTKIWLFVIAIAIHNFPEGLSVGVAAASGDMATALGVTVGIGIQNVPEGLSVAIALLAVGYRAPYAFAVALLTGVLEIFGGLLGGTVILLSQSLLPWALGFAAGAMLFVVSDEIIPETHRPEFAEGATLALFGGFGLMMFLDAVLG